MNIWNIIFFNFIITSFLFTLFIWLLSKLGKNIVDKYLKEDIYKKLEGMNILSFQKISELNSENLKLKRQLIDLRSITPRSRGILENYGLTYKSEKKNFRVNYEVEVVEVAVDKLKVIAYDFTSDDSVANDPSNRNGIIDFMKNRWVDKSEFKIIFDDAMRRQDKIDLLLD